MHPRYRLSRLHRFTRALRRIRSRYIAMRNQRELARIFQL